MWPESSSMKSVRCEVAAWGGVGARQAAAGPRRERRFQGASPVGRASQNVEDRLAVLSRAPGERQHEPGQGGGVGGGLAGDFPQNLAREEDVWLHAARLA